MFLIRCVIWLWKGEGKNNCNTTSFILAFNIGIMAVFSSLHVNVAAVDEVCRAPFISVVSCNHNHHHSCCGCALCNRIGVPYSPRPWWSIKDINCVPSSLPCNHQATSLSNSVKASSEAEQVLKGSLQHFWATVITLYPAKGVRTI